MPGTSVIQSGNYKLEIDCGFAVDAFTLDDSVKGVLDNTTYTLTGTTQFADVTAGTLNMTVRRGRKDQGDSFSAGTLTFTLNDTLAGGVFNPFDTSSPYYQDNAQTPGLAPLRQVNLIRYNSSGTAEYLFKGKIVDYDYSFVLGGSNTVSVYCADDMYLLSQTFLDAFNPSPELSGARINTVLDLPEIDYPTGASARDIATGTVNLGHDSSYNVAAGTNALNYLLQINDTAEFGRLFVSRDGKLTFDNRVGTTLSPSVATFNDTGTGIKYDNIGVSFQADQVINRAVVTGLNGTSSTASNATSINTYFIQNASITNSLLHDATEIATAAVYLLEPSPQARYTDISTPFSSLTTSQRDTVATIDIGDTISISKTFVAGTGTTSFNQDLSIEGVEHSINFNTGHRITLYTAPTTIVYYLTLDDATYGVLDADNVLG
jgi:hypothetical protein